jgi:hypothetical protein
VTVVVLTRLKAATGRTALDRRLARAEVLAARRDLLRIAEVSLLLTDGAGPMFTQHPPGTLREAVFRAAFHVEAG